jgi:hypothetical protein
MTGSLRPAPSNIGAVSLLASAALLFVVGPLQAQWEVKEFEVVGFPVSQLELLKGSPNEWANLLSDQ